MPVSRQTYCTADYNQATLRERIRKERRVELCFEDHRFFDIRRWLIAKNVMRLPAVGIKKINGEYQRVTLDTRNYNERMNLAPIPQDEVNNCPNIYQNPGY
ncbi:RagB/SusD family nutrient uptake outer membrane protein [Bacteroides ovatus]|nr:RagB/SusD family nutrient uptake outer membrane protein [Bacteroides ovatus]